MHWRYVLQYVFFVGLCGCGDGSVDVVVDDTRLRRTVEVR